MHQLPLSDHGEAIATASPADSAIAEAGSGRADTATGRTTAAAAIAECAATGARNGKIAQRIADVECRARSVPIAIGNACAGVGKESGTKNFFFMIRAIPAIFDYSI